MLSTKLFPSILVVHPSSYPIQNFASDICQQLKSHFSVNNPDLLIIDQTSGWGIDIVRKINPFLSKKSINYPVKIVFIFQSEQLNTEAQNSLLKVLEEPPEDSYLIIFTSQPATILSTITSRCQHLSLKQSTKVSSKISLTLISNIQEALAKSDSLSLNKEEVLPFLNSQLLAYQQELVKNPNQSTATVINKIIKAVKMIESNVDPKSALDYFFLS